MSDKILHHTIPGQLSRYLNSEYPLLVLFIQKYYEWLETPGTPYHLIREHLNYLNFKDSIQDYISSMQGEYLFGLPEEVLVDKELLIKHSKEIYSIIGTEKAYKFLFRILYNTEVEISYPKDNILRASDGKWIDDLQIMYLTMNSDTESLLYKKIEQNREVYPGVFEYASATVQQVTRKYSAGYVFVELSLTDVRGDFDYKYPIYNGASREWILPIGDAVVHNPGINYTTSNTVVYSGDTTWEIVFRSENVAETNCRYRTTMTKNDIQVFVDGMELQDFEFDGYIIKSEEIRLDSEIRIVFPIHIGRVTVSEVDDFNKGISRVNLLDTPIGITETQRLDALGGLNGVVEYVPTRIRKVSGYFFNADGFLSERSIVLQDSFYYQDFSYVLKTDLDVDRYKDVVDEVLHPAGMRMFGQISIIEQILLAIQSIEIDIKLKGSGEVTSKDNNLYTVYSFIDDLKEFFDDSYRIGSIADVSAFDTAFRPQEHFNIPDAMIEVNTTATGIDYWLPGYISNDPDTYIVYGIYMDDGYADPGYAE